MANSITNQDLINPTQAQKELTANALFDAGSPATLYGRRANTTTALTWGYYGGGFYYNNVLTTISNGVINLTNNAINYLEMNNSNGAVSVNTTAFTSLGFTPLYKITTSNGMVSAYEDYRSFLSIKTGASTNLSGMGDVLISSPALNQILLFNGTKWINSVSTSSVEYFNDTRKLVAYFRPIWAVSSSANTLGTWTAPGSLINTSIGGSGAWASNPRNGWITGATIGANSMLLNTDSNGVLTCKSRERFAVHLKFGMDTITSNDTSNAIFLAGISAYSSPIGTNNDFTSMNYNTFGVGFRTTDSNLQIIYFNASNVLTFLDLGASFPVPRSYIAPYAYEVIIKKTDDTGIFTFIVNRIDTAGTTATTTQTLALKTQDNVERKAIYNLRTTVAVAKGIQISDTHVFRWSE